MIRCLGKLCFCHSCRIWNQRLYLSTSTRKKWVTQGSCNSRKIASKKARRFHMVPHFLLNRLLSGWGPSSFFNMNLSSFGARHLYLVVKQSCYTPYSWIFLLHEVLSTTLIWDFPVHYCVIGSLIGFGSNTTFLALTTWKNRLYLEESLILTCCGP